MKFTFPFFLFLSIIMFHQNASAQLLTSAGPSCTITIFLRDCFINDSNSNCEDVVSAVPPSQCGSVSFRLTYEIDNTSDSPVAITSALGATTDVTKPTSAEFVSQVKDNPISPHSSTTFDQVLTNINACNGLNNNTIDLSAFVQGNVPNAPNKARCSAFEILTIVTSAFPTASPTLAPVSAKPIYYYKPTKKPTTTKRPTRKPTPQPCPYGPNIVYTSKDPYCTPNCLYVGGTPYKTKCGCYCYIPN